jgi:polar amino acid transport system permease protein
VTRAARRRAVQVAAYLAVLVLLVLVVRSANTGYRWQWGRFFTEAPLGPDGQPIAGAEPWALLIVRGLGLTLEVSALAMLGALPLGIVVGLCRTAHDPGARFLGAAYVEVFRGTPLLVQVFIWYYPLGLSTLPAAVCALACFAASYIAEIVRAGIQSIDRGQMEAARSLGLTHVQAMRHVVLPQALRRILPPLASEFIALVKDSSLASVISLHELTMATRDVQAGSYMTFEPWLTTAALYLSINVLLSLGVRTLEKRLGVARRAAAIA